MRARLGQRRVSSGPRGERGEGPGAAGLRVGCSPTEHRAGGVCPPRLLPLSSDRASCYLLPSPHHVSVHEDGCRVRVCPCHQDACLTRLSKEAGYTGDARHEDRDIHVPMVTYGQGSRKGHGTCLRVTVPGFLVSDGPVSPSLVPKAARQACGEDPAGGRGPGSRAAEPRKAAAGLCGRCPVTDRAHLLLSVCPQMPEPARAWGTGGAGGPVPAALLLKSQRPSATHGPSPGGGSALAAWCLSWGRGRRRKRSLTRQPPVAAIPLPTSATDDSRLRRGLGGRAVGPQGPPPTTRTCE